MSNLYDLDTPALIVDVRVLEKNLDRMEAYARANSVALRPHTKTHKTMQIARMQQERGATGICVAKTGEAEVFAREGFEDIVIASEVVGEKKVQRVMDLNQQVKLAVLIDSHEGLTQLAQTAKRRGQTLDVLVEIDTGDHRCGVADVDAARQLAHAADREQMIRFRGILTHEGHVYHLGTDESIEELAEQTSASMRMIADAIQRDGIEVETVSAGSTPTAPYLRSSDGITEIRPGSYGLNDLIQVGVGAASIDDCAATILSTVMSRDRSSGRFVLDAGSKTLFSDHVGNTRAMPWTYTGFGHFLDLDARIEHLNEEHGVGFTAQGTASPDVGTKLRVVPNHICACVNLHDTIHVVDGEKVIDEWSVLARGKVQ